MEADSCPQIAFPTVLALDIGDVVQVTRRPIGGAVISELGIIERVQHQIGAGKWTVTYQLSPYTPESAVMTVDGSENMPGSGVSGGEWPWPPIDTVRPDALIDRPPSPSAALGSTRRP